MSEDDEKPPKHVVTSKFSRKINQKIFVDKFGDELWEICPVSENGHWAKKKDMQHHLTKCKKKLLKNVRKVECPFNALHIVNLMEIEQHIMTCPNRVTVLNSLCDFEPKRELFEGVAMEPINVMPEIPNDWDNGNYPEAGYDPMDSTKFRTVLRPTPPGMTKTQKKAWKAKERLRWQHLSGETREKPRPAPYSNPRRAGSVNGPAKTGNPATDEGTMMQSIIDGLSGANIADPRDAMLRGINQKLNVLQLMERKLKEGKIELQRQVEAYLASMVKKEDQPTTNGDPRLSSRTPTVRMENSETNFDTDDDRKSTILPDIMTSAMIIR